MPKRMTPEQVLMYHKRKMLLQQMRPIRKLKRSPVWLYPKAIEREWVKFLDNYVTSQDRIITAALEKRLPLIYQEYDSERPARVDSYLDSFRSLMDQLLISIDDHNKNYGIEAFALDIGQKTNKWNNKEWQKTLKAVVGISTGAYSAKTQNDVEMFSYDTVDLIKTMGNQRLEKLRQHVLNGFRNGTRHEVVREQIKADYKTTHSRAKLIARDQIAKLNGKLMQTRQAELGVSQYIWHSTPDERVRPKHKAMNGQICRWDDSTKYLNTATKRWINRSNINGVMLHPGQDYQCRCWAEAIFDFTDVEGPQVTETPLIDKVRAAAAVGIAAVTVGSEVVKVARRIQKLQKPTLHPGPHPATRKKPKPAKPKAIPGPVVPTPVLPKPKSKPVPKPGRVPIPKKPGIKPPKTIPTRVLKEEAIALAKGGAAVAPAGPAKEIVKSIENLGILIQKIKVFENIDYKSLLKLGERATFYEKVYGIKPKYMTYDSLKSTRVISTGSFVDFVTGLSDEFHFVFGPVFTKNTYKELSQFIGVDILCNFHPPIALNKRVKFLIDHEYCHGFWNTDRKVYQQINSIFNSMTEQEIHKRLCTYGAKNASEFAAEAWGEYLNSPNPRPLAKRIGDILALHLYTNHRR